METDEEVRVTKQAKTENRKVSEKVRKEVADVTNDTNQDETVSAPSSDSSVNTADRNVDTVENVDTANVGSGTVLIDTASTVPFTSPLVSSERNMEIGKNAWMIKIGDTAKSLEIKIKGDVQEGTVYNLVDKATFDAAAGAGAGATSGVDSEAVVATSSLTGEENITGTIQFSDVPVINSFDYKMVFNISAGSQSVKGTVVDTLVGDATTEDMSQR